MAILVNKESRLMIQGITGREGSFHALQCRDYGTKVVAGVSPGKGGQSVEGIPVFSTAAQAVRETGANCSLIFVPPLAAVDAIAEAFDSGISLVVCITEGIPVKDMMLLKRRIEREHKGAILIGPNCPGVITPGEAKVGILPSHIFRRGPVGIVSRSGTLTYEAAYQLTQMGIGQSTAVGIGGDPVNCFSHRDAVALFAADSETEVILLIGEIGGTAEEDVAAYVASGVKKPVVAYVAGITAPPGRRMGHAGAIIAGGKGTAQEKMTALRQAGITVIENPAFIGEEIAKLLHH